MNKDIAIIKKILDTFVLSETILINTSKLYLTITEDGVPSDVFIFNYILLIEEGLISCANDNNDTRNISFFGVNSSKVRCDSGIKLEYSINTAFVRITSKGLDFHSALSDSKALKKIKEYSGKLSLNALSGLGGKLLEREILSLLS